jgi:hypothetical protein
MNKRVLFSVLCLCLAPLFALGDAMVVTRAMTASTIVEVYVETQEVRVELEIGMADIESFKNILPDSIYQDMGNAPEPIKTRVDRFFKEDFVLRADGQLLQGRIRQMEPRQRILRDEITVSLCRFKAMGSMCCSLNSFSRGIPVRRMGTWRCRRL